MTINDQQVSLKGPCQSKDKCNFGDFIELVRQISFFENEDEFLNLCGGPDDIYYKEKIDLEDLVYKKDNGDDEKYDNKRTFVVDYQRFFIAYAITLSITVFSWLFYNKVWLRRK